MLQRQHPHPRFAPDDRAILTALSRVVRRDRWTIFLVKPDMIVRWHQRLVAKHWTYPHRPGRPTTITETRRTILRFARENPTWGYRRIHGELTLWMPKTRPGVLSRGFRAAKLGAAVVPSDRLASAEP